MVNKIINDCTNCNHKTVCTFKDDYNKLKGEISKTYTNKEFYIIDIRCKHYSQNNSGMPGGRKGFLEVDGNSRVYK